MIDPFDVKFAIKFVDGDPSENFLNIAQTGDLLGCIIAAILAVVAIGAGVLYFVRHRQFIAESARAFVGSHGCGNYAAAKPKGQFFLIALAVVALVCSLATFIGSGAAKAIAEGQQLGVPVVTAQVMDDGTVNMLPLHIKNTKETDVKVKSSQTELEGEAWAD